MGFKLQLTVFITSNLAIASLIIAVLSNHWSARENDRIHIYEGLWKKCVHHKYSRRLKCMKPYNNFPPAKLVITMAMLAGTALIHLFVFTVSLYLLYHHKLFMEKPEKHLAIFQTTALSLSITAVIVYTAHYNSNYYRLQWSYVTCWVGVLCYFASVVLQIIHIGVSMKEEENRMYTVYTSPQRQYYRPYRRS